MVIWFLGRRLPLWTRIARVSLMVGSAAGVAIGAEMLRRKLGIGTPRESAVHGGGATRVRVSMGRSRAGRRRRRSVSSATHSRSEQP